MSPDSGMLVTEIELAKALHEAGREAVQMGLVVNKVPGQPFFEWDQLTAEARIGRISQATNLLKKFTIRNK